MARILILGAGFAGLWAAIGAARKLDELGMPHAADILVIDRNPYHNIRVRNYEIDLSEAALPLAGLLDPIGVKHMVAEISTIDPIRQEVSVDTARGRERLGYDRLVLTLGSELVRPAIPGLASHGFDVDSYAAATRLDDHLAALGRLAPSPREVAPLKVDWSQDVVFCTTLLGHEIMRFTDCLGLSPRRVDLYAEAGQQIAQPLVEEVLREAVSDLESCQLCLGWSLHTLKQYDDGVHATIINEQGEQREIEASYVLGCDGSRSVVRTGIGIRYVGASDSRPNFGMVFRAPGLAEQQPHGPAVHYWVLNPACPGVLGRMDMKDQWWVIANGVPAEVGQANPYALIRGLVGAEIEAEVLGTDPWTARMLLADRYRNGRVFLVGDAAHLNPPWGGHGFNTGIGDAVNIGWKLAAVLEGWGGDRFLASYEAERRPVAERTIREAVANMSVLAPELGNAHLDAPGFVGEQARRAAAQVIQASKDREFHSLGLVLGYQYDASPVIVNDGTPPLSEGQEYVPTARPGALLPHLWLPDGTSLYDRLGNGLSLLRLNEAAEAAPLIDTAAARRVPLTVIELHSQVHEEYYGAPLLLVRPDQHVAWRGASVDQVSASAVIDQVRGV